MKCYYMFKCHYITSSSEKTEAAETLRRVQSLSESSAPLENLKYAIEDVSPTKALAYRRKAPSAFFAGEVN